jgi:hypothetical protein
MIRWFLDESIKRAITPKVIAIIATNAMSKIMDLLPG